jgi:hypothetical protein
MAGVKIFQSGQQQSSQHPELEAAFADESVADVA